MPQNWLFLPTTLLGVVLLWRHCSQLYPLLPKENFYAVDLSWKLLNCRSRVGSFVCKITWNYADTFMTHVLKLLWDGMLRSIRQNHYQKLLLLEGKLDETFYVFIRFINIVKNATIKMRMEKKNPSSVWFWHWFPANDRDGSTDLFAFKCVQYK